MCMFLSLSVAAQDVKVYVAKYKDGKACATSFTFDDGNKDNFTIAAPELEKRGWRGTFWLNCSTVPGEERGLSYRMTWDDISAMHQKGHEMSNHGWAHKRLPSISAKEAQEEIEKNDSAIFVHIGVRPVTFCYPYNAKNKEVVALASKGRVGTRTRQYAFGEQSSDQQLRQRMDKAIAKQDWAVWMTHGITRGYDYFKDQSRYTSFLDYVKGLEDKIWVGTFREVAAYIAERDAVRLEQRIRGRRISVTPALDLDPELYNMPLTMVVEGVSKVKAKQDGKKLTVQYRDGLAFFEFNPYGGTVRLTFTE